jgi:hypothetical protein
MRMFKGVCIGILTLLLIPSLLALSLGIQLRTTLLSSRFVANQLARLDLSVLFEQVAASPAMRNMPREVRSAVSGSIARLGPEIGARARTALDSVYEYLLGRRNSPDLASMVGSTFLNADFVDDLVDSIDLAAVANAALKTQFSPKIPGEAAWAKQYLDDRFEKLLVELTPQIKEQLKGAAGPLVEYLLGTRKSFRVVIQVKPLLAAFRADLGEFVRETPIPQFERLPQSSIDDAIDKVFSQLATAVPASYVLTQAMLGAALPAQITSGIHQAETALAQARSLIHSLQVALIVIMGITLLLLAAVILIYHKFVPASRHLGIVFIVLGCIAVAVSFAAGTLIKPQLALAGGMSAALGKWLPGVVQSLLLPLQIFALAGILIGSGLVVASFIARPREAPSQ